MPQDNKIDVRVFPADEAVEEPLDFRDVHFISFVTGDTYGIPAVITERQYKDLGLPMKVLYINPANIAAVEAVRKT